MFINCSKAVYQRVSFLHADVIKVITVFSLYHSAFVCCRHLLKHFFNRDTVHADYAIGTDIGALVTVSCYSVLEMVGHITTAFGNFIVLSIDFLQ